MLSYLQLSKYKSDAMSECLGFSIAFEVEIVVRL